MEVNIKMVGEGTIWRDSYTVMDEQDLAKLLSRFKMGSGRPRDRYYMLKRLKKEAIVW